MLNDFKANSRIVFFRIGEINKSWFWALSKKIFFNFFSVVYQISNNKKNISKKKFNSFKKKFVKKILQEIFFWKDEKKN